jgi:ABC-2 type transport system ATP-binding protein
VILDLRDVHIGRVLRGVTLGVARGACVGLVGVQRRGKSTLVATMAGVLRPERGRVECDVPFAYLPEGGPGDPNVRVGTWLRWASMLPGWDAPFADALAAELALDRRAALGRLSQGQRVRVGLVMTLGRDVPLYLLDDPFLGLDPVARTVAERAIARRSERASVVVAGQHLEVIERLCTDLALLHEGQVPWCAPVDAWRQRFRAVRIRSAADARADPPQIIAERPTASGVELFLDDPAGFTDRCSARSVWKSSDCRCRSTRSWDSSQRQEGACCESAPCAHRVRAGDRVALAARLVAYGLVGVTLVAGERWRDGWAIFTAALLPVLLAAAAVRAGSGSDSWFRGLGSSAVADSVGRTIGHAVLVGLPFAVHTILVADVLGYFVVSIRVYALVAVCSTPRSWRRARSFRRRPRWSVRSVSRCAWVQAARSDGCSSGRGSQSAPCCCAQRFCRSRSPRSHYGGMCSGRGSAGRSPEGLVARSGGHRDRDVPPNGDRGSR